MLKVSKSFKDNIQFFGDVYFFLPVFNEFGLLVPLSVLVLKHLDRLKHDVSYKQVSLKIYHISGMLLGFSLFLFSKTVLCRF